MPICPPTKTVKKRGQKLKNSLKTISFVSWPITPNVELTKINKEADAAICFGYPAFIKNKIGLKNIPPPIPTRPEMNPIIEPIKIDNSFEIFLISNFSLLKDLLSINKKTPANVKIKNSIISNKSFSIEIEAPKKAKGTDPIRYGVSNLRLRLPDFM